METDEIKGKTMTAEQIKEHLAQFSGTECYYQHFTGMKYTDGVKALADMCGAYWLLDAIASYQSKCRRDPMLVDQQFWFLKKTDSGWILICERDQDDVAFSQKIEYSDFPLDEVQVWVQNGVILLPSEY